MAYARMTAQAPLARGADGVGAGRARARARAVMVGSSDVGLVGWVIQPTAYTYREGYSPISLIGHGMACPVYPLPLVGCNVTPPTYGVYCKGGGGWGEGLPVYELIKSQTSQPIYSLLRSPASTNPLQLYFNPAILPIDRSGRPKNKFWAPESLDPMNPYKIGDVVVLNSGGPTLTVASKDNDHLNIVWIDDDGKPQCELINYKCVHLYTEERR